jgi:hypothetical protein
MGHELRRWGGWGKKDNYMGSVPAKGPGDLYTSETLIQEKTSKFVHWLVYCHVTRARFMYIGCITRSIIRASLTTCIHVPLGCIIFGNKLVSSGRWKHSSNGCTVYEQKIELETITGYVHYSSLFITIITNFVSFISTIISFSCPHCT